MHEDVIRKRLLTTQATNMQALVSCIPPEVYAEARRMRAALPPGEFERAMADLGPSMDAIKAAGMAPEEVTRLWQLAQEQAQELAYMNEVLRIFRAAEQEEYLRWHGNPTVFTAAITDAFNRSGSEEEEVIERADTRLLDACFRDLERVRELWLLPELFAARKRRQRPNREWLATQGAGVRWLFEAAGPEGSD